MIPAQPPLRSGLLYSLVSASCFGLLPILLKSGYSVNLNTGTMLSFRFLFALFILLPYILLTKREQLKINGRTMLMACICGAFFSALQSYFFAASLKYISASTTSLILYLYPLTVTVLSAIIFKNRITSGKILAITCILAGCICVFYDAFSRQMDGKGLVLATCAMITFSVYLIFLQKALINVDSTVFSFYVIAFTALQCIIIYRPFADIPTTVVQWSICLLLALIPTVFAVILLYRAIEKIGSSHASIFSSVEPVVTVAVSALLLHEPIRLLQVMGMIFIITGIIIPNLNFLRKHHHYSP